MHKVRKLSPTQDCLHKALAWDGMGMTRKFGNEIGL